MATTRMNQGLEPMQPSEFEVCFPVTGFLFVCLVFLPDCRLHLRFQPPLIIGFGCAPPGDSIVLLGDFHTYVGNVNQMWSGVTGRNSLQDLNLSVVLL